MAQISDKVRDILLGTVRDGNKLTLPPRLSREQYVAVNLVIENMGGKWSRKDKAHVFDIEPEDLAEKLDAAVTSGTFVNRKKELQFFETPNALALTMVNLASIERGASVLEPSAGHGRIVSAIKFRGGTVCAVEIDPTNCLVISTQHDIEPHCADFLQWADDADGVEFDAIVMNPPFAKAQDIAHVMAAWNLLKVGGRLVTITSPGWKFKQDRKHSEFRSWLSDHDAIVTDLEPGTFKESGTEIATTLIVLKKEQGQ